MFFSHLYKLCKTHSVVQQIFICCHDSIYSFFSAIQKVFPETYNVLSLRGICDIIWESDCGKKDHPDESKHRVFAQNLPFIARGSGFIPCFGQRVKGRQSSRRALEYKEGRLQVGLPGGWPLAWGSWRQPTRSRAWGRYSAFSGESWFGCRNKDEGNWPYWPHPDCHRQWQRTLWFGFLCWTLESLWIIVLFL